MRNCHNQYATGNWSEIHDSTPGNTLDTERNKSTENSESIILKYNAEPILHQSNLSNNNY